MRNTWPDCPHEKAGCKPRTWSTKGWSGDEDMVDCEESFVEGCTCEQGSAFGFGCGFDDKTCFPLLMFIDRKKKQIFLFDYIFLRHFVLSARLDV